MTGTNVEVVCRTMQSQSDADAFRALNEEWISLWFRLEEKDRLTLNDPQTTIIDRGGEVYVASDGERIVGTAALIRYNDGVYELSKMAVSPDTRGQGIGRKLLSFVLDQARAMHATTVFLGSSKRLQSAVHLYESLGFRHVLPAELPAMKYERADVFMKIDLA
jgi:putative acetyltransferase